MKNLNLFAAVLLLCFSVFNISAQWLPDVRLTPSSGASYTSENNGWCTASSGNFVHVTWANRTSFVQIGYKHSSDGGITWGADTILTNNTWYYTGNPSIAVSGADVHIIWIYNHNASNVLYYKHSSDNGFTWGPNVSLGDVSNGGYISKQPSISASGTNVYIVWSSGSSNIYCKSSDNEGASWTTNIPLSVNPAISYSPSVSASGQVVNVVWQDTRDGNGEIYNRRSLNAGISWGPETRLTNNPANSFGPSVTVSGLIVNAAWIDDRDGNFEIYQKCSSDGGTTWGADTRLTNNSDSSWNPSITSSGSNVHVVWQDHRDGNWEIYYNHSTNGGLNWNADTRLTNEPAISQFPFISITGTAAHVVWTDQRLGGQTLYYKRNPTANVLGITPINSEIPKEFSLSQNYPNPFNPSTKIRFSIPSVGYGRKSSAVQIVIYDISGKIVETLVNENLDPGTYEVTWNAANYSSGVYFYKLVSAGFTDSKKMLIIK